MNSQNVALPDPKNRTIARHCGLRTWGLISQYMAKFQISGIEYFQSQRNRVSFVEGRFTQSYTNFCLCWLRAHGVRPLRFSRGTSPGRESKQKLLQRNVQLALQRFSHQSLYACTCLCWLRAHGVRPLRFSRGTSPGRESKQVYTYQLWRQIDRDREREQ